MSKLINTKTIKKFKPCQDRFDNWLKHHSNFNGDLLEFLDLKTTHSDKIWVALRVLPRHLVEIFAIDCAVAAADAAADAAINATYAANDAYAAADAAINATYAANAAAYASIAAAYAANAAANAAYAAANAAINAAVNAANAAERSRQLECLRYLYSTLT